MSKKVLIVDDNEQITSLLKEILSMKGYDSEIASAGKTAREKYQSGDFQIVIVDLKLNDENGVDLIKDLNKVRKTGFILSSGYDSPLDESEMESLNIKGFLGKPFVFDELFKLLEKVENG